MSARLVVLVSGGGTNLQALLDACQDPRYGADVVAVDAGADWPVLEQQGEPAGGAVGASIASSTASATRGSWQSLLTHPAPGFSARQLRAAVVSGYQVR